jgi:hypothetical protein
MDVIAGPFLGDVKGMRHPELKQVLDLMKAELKADLNALKNDLSRVRAELQTAKSELKAEVKWVETSLLTEFHRSVPPAEMRARTHAAVLGAMDWEREERAGEFERK